jgi:hypothetical protein
LKFLGIVVTGGLGIYGTVYDYRDSNTKELTNAGRRAVMVMVVAFVVTLLSALFEQINSGVESKKQDERDIWGHLGTFGATHIFR